MKLFIRIKATKCEKISALSLLLCTYLASDVQKIHAYIATQSVPFHFHHIGRREHLPRKFLLFLKLVLAFQQLYLLPNNNFSFLSTTSPSEAQSVASSISNLRLSNFPITTLLSSSPDFTLEEGLRVIPCQIIQSMITLNFKICSNFYQLQVLLRYDNYENLKVSFITFLEL